MYNTNDDNNTNTNLFIRVRTYMAFFSDPEEIEVRKTYLIVRCLLCQGDEPVLLLIEDARKHLREVHAIRRR